jgi:polyisoprenyl-teichoic acid--peptidoglycan teichoic acid transferase
LGIQADALWKYGLWRAKSSPYEHIPMNEITQPTQSMNRMQSVRTMPGPRRRRRPSWFLILLFLILVYFLAPLRTNFLLLGADDSPSRGSVGRTDTIMLVTVVPLKPYIGVLSIPRDLWVQIPDVGEQRINTAYFFAESQQRGRGGPAAARTIRENFDVPVRYYAVIHMFGLVSLVDALGGVEVSTSQGSVQLNGEQALEFVRERSSSDDFGRMQRTQTLLTAVLRKMLSPASWRDLPALITAVFETVDTNLPPWQWPRLSFALLRSFLFGIDSRTISREMVIPFQTSQGAQVLAPNWEAINPVLSEMFGH